MRARRGLLYGAGALLCATLAASAVALAADIAPVKAPPAKSRGKSPATTLILPWVAFRMPPLGSCEGNAQYCRWLHAHRAIYHKHNKIAYLEANPDIDDAVKGPRITRLRHKMLQVRARIGPRWPVWPTPCCYSRRPIYIR